MATGFAWGIDVGNRALKAIKLVRADGGLRIDDFEIIEHENVLSHSGDNKESLIQAALNNFVQRHPIKGGVAAISVSGVSSFARFIKLPPVEKKKIPEIVRFEAIQQIPFPLDDVEWSYQLFQAPDSPEVEVGIFAMRRELVNHQIRYFTDVDLNVQVVQMNPLAVYNAMFYDGRLKGTTMIVDLGAENTDLIIADGETIWMRSIPIGGNNFTEVLVKSFKLPFGKAEELKRNANTSKYARQIFQAMRPVFADLVAEIQRSMGFYSSVHRDSRIKKIIALGGTFRLAGLQKYLQQNLQLDVEKLNDLAAGAPPDAKLAATFNQNLLSMVSSYGLAIQAMGEGKISSSLLPARIRREKISRDKTKWFGAAAAVFVLGAGVAAGRYYSEKIQYDNAAGTRAHLDDVIRNANSLASEWTTKVEQAGGSDQTKISNVRQMLDNRDLWTKLPAAIFSALPPLPPGYADGNVKLIQRTPRDQRTMIQIDKLTSDYVADLTSQAGATPGAPAAPAVAGAAAPVNLVDIPAGSRGYVINLTWTTPHREGYPYILKSLVPSLQKMNRAAMEKYNKQNPTSPQHFYFTKVVQLSGGYKQLKDSQTWISQVRDSYAKAQALAPKPPAPMPGTVVQQPGMPPGVAPAGPPPVDPAFIDRLTGEDRSKDWTGSLSFVVVLVDPGTAPPPPH